MELQPLSKTSLVLEENDEDRFGSINYNKLEQSFKYALAHSNLAQVIKELDIEANAKKRSQSLAT